MKKVRRQDWEKEMEEDAEDRGAPVLNRENLRPAAAKAPSHTPPKHSFQVGDLVSGRVEGTVACVVGDLICVLDSNGLLHYPRHWEVWSPR